MRRLEAIRRRVCGACLDQRDDGSCGLRARTCTLETHLDEVVEAMLAIESDHLGDYLAALEAQVCRTCPSQDHEGVCQLRDHGECALYAYLPLVLDAIDEVRSALRHHFRPADPWLPRSAPGAIGRIARRPLHRGGRGPGSG